MKNPPKTAYAVRMDVDLIRQLNSIAATENIPPRTLARKTIELYSNAQIEKTPA
ncbi:hypothetical protein H6F93_01375 [Leptolyngbya sp. FACHB-671]|uniref:hypothetical protein n=1 Tax=Leptolyngbya sp. FACHB-671 TaxID=2692812 RepID=UPI0016893B2F|nr:hypothetical protein [Leptolyngbya sp. FACHB-671]MBD2066190.1 hypothetical protein [Leptolyngbya sp. FACHB-671]